jgi:hypothetical protein
MKDASFVLAEVLVADVPPLQRSASEVDMRILDRFPIKNRGTGVVVAINGHMPVPGQRLRRTSDGHEWRIEAVDERTGAGENFTVCIVGDPPSIGDDVVLCE